jgi:hypothetical protein
MDEDRRIRFLIPPLLFVASLLLGAFVDQSTRDLIVKVFAGGGIVVVVVGYLIGTFTYFILRLVFYIKASVFKGPRFHESALSDEAFCMLWKRLDAPLSWSLIMAFFEKGTGFIGGYSVDGMHLALGQIPLRGSSSRFFSATF